MRLGYWSCGSKSAVSRLILNEVDVDPSCARHWLMTAANRKGLSASRS